MSALPKSLSPALKILLKEAINDLLSTEQLWEEIDQFLQEYLDESECHINFGGGKTQITVRLGDRGVDYTFGDDDIEIIIETSGGVDLPPAQAEEIEEQIAGIDRFSKKLAEARNALETSLRKRKQKPTPEKH